MSKKQTTSADVEREIYLLQTYALESLLPMTTSLQKIERVLDVPCRLGYWADALAHAYPHIHVAGLDDNPQHITAIQQRADHPDNVQFKFHDLQQLELKEEQKFDLIHIDAPLIFRPPQGWGSFLKQCKHLLKRGGSINMVNIVPGAGSSDAYQRLVYLTRQYIDILNNEPDNDSLDGFAAKPEPVAPGTTFCRLLSQAGFKNVRYTLHPINLSGQAYQRFLDSTLQEISQALCNAHLIDKDEFVSLLERKQQETRDIHFCAMGMVISVLAQKKS